MSPNPDGIVHNTEQAKSYILVYEDNNEKFNLDVLKEKLNSEGCKYVSIDIYYSKYSLDSNIDYTNIFPTSNHYYYLYIVFASRQKLQVDSVTKNVLYPRYYKYNEDCFPKVLEKYPSPIKTNSVLFMLLYFKDQNKTSLLSHIEPSKTPSDKVNLEYHFRQILTLENEEQFYIYVKDNNLYYYLENLFTKYRSVKLFNNNMSKMDPDSDLLNIPDFLNPYLETHINTSRTQEPPVIFQNTPRPKPTSINSTYMKELEDSTLTLEGYEKEITETLEGDLYDINQDIAVRIFNSKNVTLSPILNNIVIKKHNESSNPKLENNGYRFLFYEKRLTSIPYRTNNPNKSLSSIFLYLSKDYKEKYLKYLSKNEQDNYPDIQKK